MDSPMDGQEIVNRMHEVLKKEITPITYDAFISVGFSREEAMQLLMALVDGIAGDALGGK